MMITVISKTRNKMTKKMISALVGSERPILSDKLFGKRRPKLASDMPSLLMVQPYTLSLGMILVPSRKRIEKPLYLKLKIILLFNRTFSIGMLTKLQPHHSELLKMMMNSIKTSSPITIGIGQDTEPNH